MQSLTAGGLMPKAADYPGAQQFLFTGESGFYMQGEWEITTAQSIKGLDFGMVPVPTLYDKPATQADSHTFILPKMDRNDDQVQRAMGVHQVDAGPEPDLGRGRSHAGLPAHVRKPRGTRT